MSGSLRLAPITGDEPEFQAALAAEGLPIDDLCEDGRAFFRISIDEETVGYGGFELHGDYALLRSMVITPARRGQGDGRAATELLLREARAAGAREAFLLTLSASAFFERLGFARIDRDAAPAEIRRTRQVAELCPSSAILLRRELDE